MAVTFTKNATSFSISNPVRNNKKVIQKFQMLGRTASGGVYTYDKGVTTYKLELSFENLREDEKTLLENFYNTTIDGIMNTFTYIDHQQIEYTARFLDTELNFEEIDNVGKNDSYFTIVSSVYPSTYWDEGIYNCSFNLEVVEN